MTKFFIKSFLLVLLLTSLIYWGCSDSNPVTPVNNQIRGTIIFVDTNFILSGGSYLVSAFGMWPPQAAPSAYDTIHITTTGGKLETIYNYTLVNVDPGEYVVSVGFRKQVGGASPVLSIYGCDTIRPMYSQCPFNPSVKAVIQGNGQSVSNINMLSWADTTNKIF